MLGLAGPGFDQAKAQTSASTLVGEEKTDGPGTYDEDVCVQGGIVHGYLHENL
jgi:hypothetical protein